jgi:photosystem II stability/assembly factor-like uncharacterized protein
MTTLKLEWKMKTCSKIIVLSLFVIILLAHGTRADWNPIGGTNRPWVGRGVDISIGGTGDEKTIYIADDYYFLYKSTNGGGSWVRKHAGDQQATFRPSTVECWPQDPDTVYIDRFHENYMPYASYDGGENWADIGSGRGFVNPRIMVFQVNPTDASEKGCQLWAGCYPYTSDSGAEPLFFRRLECGGNWDHLADNDGLDFDGPVTDMVLDNTDVELYFAIGRFNEANGGVLFLDNNVWSSTFPESYPAILDDIDCQSLGIDADDNDRILASDWLVSSGGLFKTINGGTNWDRLSNAPDSIYDIVFIPGSSGQTIFVSTKTDGIFKSTNGGQGWNQYNQGIRCKDIFSLDIDPDLILYAAGKWSVYKMSYTGTEWAECTQGMRVPLVNGLFIDLPKIYCASDFDFVHFSTDDGDTWMTQFSFDSDTLFDASVRTINPFAVERDGSASRLLYTALNIPGDSKGDLIQRSTDEGKSWEQVYAPSNNTEGKRCNAIVVNQDAPSVAYAAFDYHSSLPVVMKTTNSGTNWSSANSGLPSDNVTDISLSPGIINDILYVTTGLNGVYYSSDGGANWTQRGLSGKTLFDIATSPISNSTVYAAASDGVWKSTNSGSNWTASAQGLSGKEVIEIEIHPTSSMIMAAVAKDATRDYVYLSLDAGTRWMDISVGLTSRFIPYFEPSSSTRPYVPLSIDPEYSTSIYLGTLNGIMEFSFRFGTQTVSSDTTWTSDHPILLLGDVSISPGATLTIEEGTNILISPKMDESASGSDAGRVEFIVNGALDAIGTSSEPIAFLPCIASTAADTAEWYGIICGSTGSVTLNNCEVERSIYGVKSSYGTLDIRHSSIEDIANTAVYSAGTDNNAVIDSNTFGHCYTRAIDLSYGVGHDIIGNQISQCKNGIRYSIYTGSATPLDVKYNIIENSDYPSPEAGIYITANSGTAAYVIGNTISGFNQGMYLSYISTGGVSDNYSHDNSTYGVYINNSTVSFICNSGTRNEFSDNYIGISCNGSTSSLFTYNKAEGNSYYGVYTASASTPNFGIAGLTPGHNAIYNSSKYDFYRDGVMAPTVRAESCYWGGGAPAYFGNLDYTPYSTSNPLPRLEPTFGGQLPEEIALVKTYPNPFNPTAIIEFSIPHEGAVRMEIYNIIGQKVKTLCDGYYNSGTHTLVWDGTNDNGEQQTSGVYFASISGSGYKGTAKMTLLR